MATKAIPAKVEVTCDRCGVVCHNGLGKGRRRMQGRLILKAHGLDFVGDPAGCADREWDLCDDCFKVVEEAAIRAIFAATPSSDEQNTAMSTLLRSYTAERTGRLGGVQLDSEAMEAMRRAADDVAEWARAHGVGTTEE